MAVIQNKIFGRISTGQTLDTWQMGNPETLLDVIKELRQLQRTIENNNRLMQVFFEHFHNPFQAGFLVVGPQTMFSLAQSQVVIENGAIQVGQHTRKDLATSKGNYGGSRLEVYAEGTDPTANPSGSDDLYYIRGPADWNVQRSTVETCELLWLERGGNCDIRVYETFGQPGSIRLDQTSPGFRDLIDSGDTLVLMKTGVGVGGIASWHEVSYSSF
jgi:hypothetical protein